MKPCPHCGKELPQEMQFCPYCMEKLITETVIGDTPVRRRRRWWLWLIIALLLLLLLLCGLWLMWKWRHPPPPKKEDAASVGASVTTTAAASAASTASTRQTASDATATTTKHPPLTYATGGTSTTHATTTSAASGVTSTGTRGSSAATSTTPRGSSVTPTASTASPCGAGHSWEDITEMVHVEEKGHYETKTVEKRLTLFRCALCYKEFDVLEDYYDHFGSQHDGDSLEVVFRDRYETFEEYREVEEQTWVVDTPAHDKTVTVGRRCRVCGKTETNEHKE